MTKRMLDVAVSVVGLLLTAPLICVAMFLVWRQDHHSPLYLAPRAGRNGRVFSMVKLRSMVINADRSGVNSTSADDKRITAVGHVIRRYKLDELTQLWNVLKGDMSLVGPRPNLESETQRYTEMERRLLQVRPGITDFSSIVFSDEGEILRGQEDPDRAYDQLIRPGKSLLGLFYIEHRSLWVDVQLMWLTALAIVSKPRALEGVQRLLRRLGGGQMILELASRRNPLVPMPLPGGKPDCSAPT